MLASMVVDAQCFICGSKYGGHVMIQVIRTQVITLAIRGGNQVGEK